MIIDYIMSIDKYREKINDAIDSIDEGSMLKKNRIQIYLAEDNPDHAELLRDMLEENIPSFKLVHVENGELLLELLEKKPESPSLILLDLKMPKLSGLETLKKIRELDKHQHTKVIITTTSSMKSDVDAAMKLGATHFLTKPLNYDDIKDYILLNIN